MTQFENLFKNHPNINQDYFLAAIPPWEIPEKEAIKLYVEYVKSLVLDDPDKDGSIEHLKNGLKYVFKFCKEKDLTFEDYLVYSEQALPCWVTHLKKHSIDFHTLHALQLSKPVIDSELLEFVIPNFFTNYQRTKQKFYNSKRMKNFGKKAKEKLETVL
jgi:hypothetical protein